MTATKTKTATTAKAEKLAEANGRAVMVLFWAAMAVAGIVAGGLMLGAGNTGFWCCLAWAGAVVNAFFTGLEMAVAAQLKREADGESE